MRLLAASWFALIKRLNLKTSALKTPYGGQFTLSTQLIKQNYLGIPPIDMAP